MTDKELIKQEIEYRLSSGKYSINSKQALEDIIVFIDSIPEEPKCIYNKTLEERKKFCKYCSAACVVRIEEEPVSEDLEEAAEAFYDKCNIAKSSWWDEGILHKMSESKKTFIAGAEWYNQQIKEGKYNSE